MRKKLLIALLAAALLCGCSAKAPEPSPLPPPTEDVTSEIPVPTAVLPSPEEALLAQMSLEEKAWQMLILSPDQLLSARDSDLEAWAETLAVSPVGGFIIYGQNIESEQQLKNLITNLKATSETAPFVGIDEEGGKVARLSYALGVTTDFKPMYTYKEQGAETAYANAFTIASDLSGFGFNLNFAPVADVWTNPLNTVIGERAYSDDPREASELVSAAVSGFSKGGIICTLKHFPGHGDTEQDSHFSDATSYKTAEELMSAELLPFLSGLESGAGMVMVGHISLPEIDPKYPATMSYAVINNILRLALNYDGVVISDDFRMAAITKYPEAEAVTRAVNAGCDIILCPSDPRGAVRAIMENISEERINESVLRILKLKTQNGLI